MFTALWSRDRYLAAKRYMPAESRFEVLFGGPHVSLPSFRRAGMRQGDWICPIHVHAGTLHVLGRMQVREIVDLWKWQLDNPARARELGKFDLSVSLEPRPTEGPRLALYYLAPTCTDEAAVGEHGTAFLSDLTFPPGKLTEIRYVSRRGDRPIKHVTDEKITSISSLQGIYRLSAASQEMFRMLVDGAAG
jgi:hypothetical protein